MICKKDWIFNFGEERLNYQIHSVYLSSYSILWDLDWAVWVKFKYEWVSKFKNDSTESRDKTSLENELRLHQHGSPQVFSIVSQHRLSRPMTCSCLSHTTQVKLLTHLWVHFYPKLPLSPRYSAMKCMWPSTRNRASLFRGGKTDD